MFRLGLQIRVRLFQWLYRRSLWFYCWLVVCLGVAVWLYLDLDTATAANAPHQSADNRPTPVSEQAGYEQHAFNVPLSERIGARRHVPDTRHVLCRNASWSQRRQPPLPSATVVMCFHNEAVSTLVRSVTSVLDRSPPHLLAQLLLIDDCSSPHLSAAIGERAAQLPEVVTLVRSPVRLGLVRARLLGAERAVGHVLVFLDSHVEVNTDWLLPLLNLVASNSRAIAVPIVDVINPDTFVYTPSPLVRGTFNWDLQFKWQSIPREYFSSPQRYVLPIDTPTMSGGLFAVQRQFFFDIGAYDAGMDVWGAENLELSFRVWMCGGRVQILPCSRVGHVFRKRRPYGVPVGMRDSEQNALRVVHVWLDDYKQFFFDKNPEAKWRSYGDVSERVQLRRRLNCSSFGWYVQHVHPTLQLPNVTGSGDSGGAAASGLFQLRLHASRLCVQPVWSEGMGAGVSGARLQLRQCRASVADQLFNETRERQLVWRQRYCLQADRLQPSLQSCRPGVSRQHWNYSSRRDTAVYSLAAGLCLAAEHRQQDSAVLMDLCDEQHAVVWDLVTAQQ